MTFGNRHDHSEDMFADTRMSFGDHLEDLRAHLWRAIYGFLIAMVISFIPGWQLLKFIARPVEIETNRFYDERVKRVAKELREGSSDYTALNQPRVQKIEIQRGNLRNPGAEIAPDSPDSEWVTVPVRIYPLDMAIDLAAPNREVGKRPGLSTLGPMEAFMAYIKVCFICGLVLGSPWIFYQIWSFVAAGLYPHEKRLVNVYLPVSVVLFAVGAVLCQFYVIPNALQGLLWFNYWLNLEPDLRFNEWLSFAILLPVLFGLSFQLPMLMYFLEQLGIMTLDAYVRKWRIAVFLIHVFAGAIVPVDIFSMEVLALTMCGLYGLGMLMCWVRPRKQEEEIEPEDSEELVEV